jgi:hypothetical protein
MLTRDGGDGGVADVGLVEVEVVADDGDERGRGERGQEAGEEGDPREVERAHVRRREAVDADGRGLVLRVHWEREFLRAGVFRTALLDGEWVRGLLAGDAVHGHARLPLVRHRSQLQILSTSTCNAHHQGLHSQDHN